MNKKTLSALLAVTALVFTQSAWSDSIIFEIDDILAGNGSQIQMQVIGTGFASDADAGEFGASWDPTVLSYVGTVVDNPPWDTPFLTETDVATGRLNSVFLGSTSNAGTSFDVAVITFDVIGAAGDSTTVLLDSGDFDSGWFAPGAIEYPSVTYGTGNVTVTPIPAAAWLFGSALGFLGVSRRLLGREVDRLLD